MELLNEVHLERAADTAVLQGDERVVLLGHNPALLDKGSIDIHFTDIIDDNGEENTFIITQDTVEQRCFSATQIACDEQDRYFI
jgi:hypothetical protein